MASDVLIIGGGVIGLSLAYELSQSSARVRVIDRQLPGQESSWAGAGILYAAHDRPGMSSYDRLLALSHARHPLWAQQLREETGLDNGYRPCGGLYVAHDESELPELEHAIAERRQRGLIVEQLDAASLCEREPQLAPALAAYRVPEESQLRNPRHLKALLIACQRRGVEITAGAEVRGFTRLDSRIMGVVTQDETITADRICLCGGAWSGLIAAELGVRPQIKPVRGQIALLDRGALMLRHVVNHGERYLVPRDDGRVLVGSTEEHVGFEKRTTAGGIGGLLDWAQRQVPGLGTARFERAWAGLRPGTSDGLPYLGRVPHVERLWLAAGHFRSGLTLSCATAVVMAQALLEQPTAVDLTPFRIDRH